MGEPRAVTLEPKWYKSDNESPTTKLHSSCFTAPLRGFTKHRLRRGSPTLPPRGNLSHHFIPKLVEYQSLKHFKERKCRGPSNINLKPGVSNQEQTPASNQPHTFFLSPTETLQALPGGRFQVVPFINKLAWYVTLNPRPSAFGCPFLRIYQRGKRMAWAMDCT